MAMCTSGTIAGQLHTLAALTHSLLEHRDEERRVAFTITQSSKFQLHSEIWGRYRRLLQGLKIVAVGAAHPDTSSGWGKERETNAPIWLSLPTASQPVDSDPVTGRRNRTSCSQTSMECSVALPKWLRHEERVPCLSALLITNVWWQKWIPTTQLML